jgi:hypothetical protein
MPGPVAARSRLLLLLAVAVLACVLAACSDEPVTVDEGEIPGSVPDDFPVPAGAVIGTTVVDRTSHRTEFRLNIPEGSTRVVRFFTLSLVENGYVVDDSAGDGTRWTIEFSRGILRGTVLVEPAGPGAATVLVSINRS